MNNDDERHEESGCEYGMWPVFGENSDWGIARAIEDVALAPVRLAGTVTRGVLGAMKEVLRLFA